MYIFFWIDKSKLALCRYLISQGFEQALPIIRRNATYVTDKCTIINKKSTIFSSIVLEKEVDGGSPEGIGSPRSAGEWLVRWKEALVLRSLIASSN